MTSTRKYGIATTLCFGAAALSMMLGCERDAPTQADATTAPEVALAEEGPAEEGAELPAEEGAAGDEAPGEDLPSDEDGSQNDADAASSVEPTAGPPPVPETLSRGQLRQFGNADMLRAFFESKPLDFLEFLTFMSVADDEPLTPVEELEEPQGREVLDRKSTRLNSSHVRISYAVFCLKKKKKDDTTPPPRKPNPELKPNNTYALLAAQYRTDYCHHTVSMPPHTNFFQYQLTLSIHHLP